MILKVTEDRSGPSPVFHVVKEMIACTIAIAQRIKSLNHFIHMQKLMLIAIV
jgi:hypothetical protein